MNPKLPLAIVLGTFIVFVISALCISYITPQEQSTPGKSGSDESVTSAQSKPTTEAEAADENTKYLLILENDTICGYRTQNSARELLLATPAQQALISADDYKSLLQGITVTNYEELCMYFESYAS